MGEIIGNSHLAPPRPPTDLRRIVRIGDDGALLKRPLVESSRPSPPNAPSPTPSDGEEPESAGPSFFLTGVENEARVSGNVGDENSEDLFGVIEELEGSYVDHQACSMQSAVFALRQLVGRTDMQERTSAMGRKVARSTAAAVARGAGRVGGLLGRRRRDHRQDAATATAER